MVVLETSRPTGDLGYLAAQQGRCQPAATSVNLEDQNLCILGSPVSGHAAPTCKEPKQQKKNTSEMLGVTRCDGTLSQSAQKNAASGLGWDVHYTNITEYNITLQQKGE